MYSIYIISKGRYTSNMTARFFEKVNIPYKLVVEPQEFTEYAKVISKQKILVLPFSNLGQGSIPARNWVWEYSLQNNEKRHWIVDDNINHLSCLIAGKRYRVQDAKIIDIMEDCIHQYKNIALAGPQYEFFCSHNKIPPVILNTRIYSFINIDNTLPFRWRGTYNEDTDLSLRVLQAGYCTVLFNYYLQKKTATMRVKGGNTDELYKNNGRLLMAQSLQEQHPLYVKIGYKWGRPQHIVDYSSFKYNKLIKNKEYTPKKFSLNVIDRTY